MLIEFSVGNFRSFRERARLSMVATRLVAKNKRLDEENVFSVDGNLSLLRSAVIYGANASGKSNFVAALAFMREFVLNSSKETQAEEPIPTEPFQLREGLASEPSFFEIIGRINGVTIRYGFEVTRERVVSEWLFSAADKRESRLFVREGDRIEVARAFREGRGLEEKTRSNALFLSVVAQFNGESARQVLAWFRRLAVISGLRDVSYLINTISAFAEPEFASGAKEFVRRLDLGIADIWVKPPTFALEPDLPDQVKELLLTSGTSDFRTEIGVAHQVFDKVGNVVGERLFDFHSQESEGTKKLFALAGPVLEALANGTVLLADELDARLHPILTQAIVRLFNSTVSNPKSAQLIFTTQDTNLLGADLFRRDQVWFTEKDRQGGTALYSLAEFKVRNDASFEKDYIQGRFGAVPFVGDLSTILSGGHAA